MAWVTVATDNFNRANTVGPDLGPNWTNVFSGFFAANGYQIVSNAAAPTTLGSDKMEYYSGASFANDQYSQAKMTVSGTSGGTGPGVMVRCGTNGSGYRVTVDKAVANNIQIGRFDDSSTFSTIGLLLTTTWVDGDVLRIEAQGNTIRAFQNGVQLGADIIDAVLTTGTPGIGYSSTATAASLDDWEGGAQSGGLGDNPPIGILGRGAGW